MGRFGYAIYHAESEKIETLPYSAIRYNSNNNYVYVAIEGLAKKIDVITGTIF